MLILGGLFHGAPATAPAKLWPYFLFGYAVLATVLPWLLGCFSEGEFDLPHSLILGILFARPVGLAARWLSHSPYRLISFGCWAMVGLWGIHLLVVIGVRLRRHRA